MRQFHGSRVRTRRAHWVGFTLIEVMIAMVLTSVVAMIVVGLLLSQVRYVSQLDSDARSVDRISTAQAMLATEISTLTSGAVLFARSDSIAFRLSLSWGIVCGPVNRNEIQSKPVNKKSKTGATAPATSSTVALSMEPAAAALNAPTPEGFAVAEDGAMFVYYPVSSWSSVAIVQDEAAATACMRGAPQAITGSKDPRKSKAPVPPTATQVGSVEDYYTSTQLATIVGGMPDERSLLYSFVLVSYYFKNDGSGLALYRTSSGNTQKVASYFANSAGFTYRLENGAASTTVAAASLPQIVAVRPNLPAIRAARPSVKADTLTVQPWLYMFNAQ